MHYCDEPGRRSAYLDAVTDGMPPGYGVGDAAALHFRGTDLHEVVSSRAGARARYVFADDSGRATERELPVRYLGAPGVAAADVMDRQPMARDPTVTALLRPAVDCAILVGSGRPRG